MTTFRLESFYRKAVAAEKSVPEEGAFCEQLVLIRTKEVKPKDESSATMAQHDMLAKADACAIKLSASDRSFEQMLRLNEETDHGLNARALEDLSLLFSQMSNFDLSRSKARDFALIVDKAKKTKQDIADSDLRVNALLKAVNNFNNDQSAAMLLSLVDALKLLNDLDRERLKNSHQAALEVADQAFRSLSESRTRLAKLPQILNTVAAYGLNGQIGQQLIEATAAIIPLDELIAIPEQKDALQKARMQVQPLAWSFLKQRLDALALKQDDPDALQAVVRTYQLVQVLPNGALSEDQQSLLTQASAAAGTLSASDERLAALARAADAWQQNPEAKNHDLLSAYHAITVLDKQRFKDVHIKAWDILLKAEAILCGPKCGLTTANKRNVPIYVFSSAMSDLNREVAETLRSELQGAGFQMVANQSDAALKGDVSILGSPEPKEDLSGPGKKMLATANLKLSMTWAADDSLFYTDQVQELASDGRGDVKLRNRALLAAINKLRQRFQQAVESQ
ncbi:MAG: hypothetical protein ACXWT1_03920 [Methylobacter sp.]